MKRTKIRRDTPKAIKRMAEEAELKRQHCLDIGGVPYVSSIHKGVIIGYSCVGVNCPRCKLPPDFRGLQLIHKFPKGRGGKSTKENTGLLCASCHSHSHGIHEIKP